MPPELGGPSNPGSCIDFDYSLDFKDGNETTNVGLGRGDAPSIFHRFILPEFITLEAGEEWCTQISG